MATTYLELTNRVLRRLNEVELTSSNFSSAKGLHAATRDAVLDTIRKINNSKYKWPFNANSNTQVLTIGQEEYDWPASFMVADWQSFQIQKDDTLNINHRHLKPINREEWFRSYRDMDMDAGTDGKTVPEFVFESNNGKWGLTPSPDKAYSVNYRYWTNPADLSAYDDETSIPSEFDYVITAGAMYYMHLFHDNTERAAVFQKDFQDGLNHMVNKYPSENHHHMTNRMVN